ncbi:hypothetical protein [Microcella frigidaquae]|uniref:Uncharacterized protein n=1 Tax=Microcella frigidaquae TaxID=424758 RepID=A0A840XAG2_9MICO|nr:hypothetical protein [Microcella frigidaquae]NHN44490.1 hypothetical protein [Microcella frigidaquae]
MTAAPETRRRRRWPWIVGVIVALLLAIVAAVALPIVLHNPQGSSGQGRVPAGEYPTEVTATGDDGRERTLSVAAENGNAPDLSAVQAGDRLVVTGAGYDGDRGLYVAVCRIPDELDAKPGPCLGGVGSQEVEEFEEGVVQWAPSNWINEAFAWRLFGARSFDDTATGAFTAYIEVPAAADENVDCTVEACGLYTRNDHTAASDRVQDLYVPLSWAE